MTIDSIKLCKDTGGPAFPCDWQADDMGSQGMTMRDWFAGQATSEDIQKYIFTGGSHEEIQVDANGKKYISHVANARTREEAKYAYADAMLAAREVK